MKASKISTLLIVLILGIAIMLLVACGENGDKETNANGSNNDENSPAEEVKEELEDGNISILYHTSKEAYEDDKNNNPDAYDALWETVDEFEEVYGGKVNVTAVPFGDQTPTLITMVNAGEQVDVAQANDQNFPIYPINNILLPIDDHIDVNDSFYNEAITNTYTFGGKPYAVGVGTAPVVIYYNKTLFENNGLKTPLEYYEDGEWTWENFRNVAMEMTQDHDGDGNIDQYGFGWWDGDYNLFINSNNETILKFNEDGTIDASYNDSAVVEALEFVQDAYLNDKYINKDAEGDYFIGQIKDGKLAMTAEYGFNGFNVFDGDYEIDFAPFPIGPNGVKDVGPGGLSGWSIPSASQNPEGATVFINMMLQNEASHSAEKNLEKFGEEKVELMNRLSNNILTTPIGIEGYWDANWQIVSGIREGTPVGTFSENAKNVMEEGIDITLTQ